MIIRKKCSPKKEASREIKIYSKTLPTKVTVTKLSNEQQIVMNSNLTEKNYYIPEIVWAI